MATSFYGQELHRALKEQGAAIHGFKLVNVGTLQAVARVRLLEGHSIDVTLTQQGYKVECKVNEGVAQIFETIEDLFHSTSPLYTQKRSEALFEALKRIS
ncbi:hypothetical protein P691DRAFT_804042 [Macrolepiota fuliginosa MF-IS2]|uniref:GSKIP domain-containing protein n=1 Tax=Macrolepiota fuliginosa MF-IS2 TaxID=1400762 RepID=A0A9P5XSN9_9AGAR|nr:hypothetical protein P691DRAFT_804042 [Macrolepiota fuliginosa MF-IS2]